MSTFAERFKELRKKNNLTQKELADIFHKDSTTISKYENGKAYPGGKELEEYASFFNVSVDYLLARTDEPRPADKIKKALSDDPELLAFWDELSKREDLQLMFKQTRDLDPATIKQIIEIIRTFEKEEQERYN
ncbi:MAG: helix-turn-helix transcriptional regulator [Firmicutes bacterium]|nr:helix-turn-helix transcriptional regulator [Bacillota bacterium]